MRSVAYYQIAQIAIDRRLVEWGYDHKSAFDQVVGSILIEDPSIVVVILGSCWKQILNHRTGMSRTLEDIPNLQEIYIILLCYTLGWKFY